MISVGDRLPDATFMIFSEKGPETVDLGAKLNGRKVVMFGLPGAFTRGCSMTHLPSFIRTRQALADKGVDEVICVSVNDPFVMTAWGQQSGAAEAGITMLADPMAEFTKAIGLAFSAPVVGLYDRCQRFALMAEDGVIKVLNLETEAGACKLTVGEELLEQI
ncbi:peroxiredoxin [Ruegeria sp. WL0004]|uniref:Glutathione-dependent peroxiredoxin n=1 Tax=Ruegeria marisflavi TaxID=2984152 RepID=A0ABT2WNB1_9RHOB|nr:peroxiredoxin [Ruegeria sp. WL0004]MCU9837371.1 peroxiredoxin [Ruegeria sp. WL0004]